jgi:hypothetical protein
MEVQQMDSGSRTGLVFYKHKLDNHNEYAEEFHGKLQFGIQDAQRALAKHNNSRWYAYRLVGRERNLRKVQGSIN